MGLKFNVSKGIKMKSFRFGHEMNDYTYLRNKCFPKVVSIHLGVRIARGPQVFYY